MKTMSIFLAIALTSSPMPAENYYSSTSPEVAAEIMELVINGEYREYLDFNGDGNLNMADVVGVSKRYADNCKYGNEITLDNEVIDSIVSENYSEACIYWEIDRVNGNLTRQYELAASEIMTAEIYMEFENYSECITVEVNPFTETISVLNDYNISESC